MPSIEFIKERYPLHWCVWNNDYIALDGQLSSTDAGKESIDCRGRTPLMLAVALGHIESVKVLLQYQCNVLAETTDGWTVLQEAVSTGDVDLVQLLLEHRDRQRHSNRVGGIPHLLRKLKEAPDFYVEMKWEFTSWVPLVSRMCPSDTYKVYKQGSNVRIDTTLLGFDQSSWQRGNRTYIFKGGCENAIMMEVDHELGEVFSEELRSAPASAFPSGSHAAEAAAARLAAPIVTTFLDTDRINFERTKAGLWGWRSDKSEEINGYNCKVLSASNVELVTQTRTEHLSVAEKERARTPRTALQSFLGIAETEHRATTPEPSDHEDTYVRMNPSNITAEEYFDSTFSLGTRDIGRPKEMIKKVQRFRANLWLCEDYPLALQEQLMPVVDLMAISSPHFAKLKHFIQMQLPAGFPVKIEIPLFHVLHARITFGNIFGLDADIPGVTRVEEPGRLSCFVSDDCFEPPSQYVRIGGDARPMGLDDEDGLVQLAIEQSLAEAAGEGEQLDIWEALRARRPVSPSVDVEQRELQRAIQASLCFRSPSTSSQEGSDEPSPDNELEMALMASRALQEEDDRRKREEESMLERVLQMSMSDK